MIVIHETRDCKLMVHERKTINYKTSDQNIVKYSLTERLFQNFKIKRKEKLKQTETADSENSRINQFLTECKTLKLFCNYSEDDIETLKNENIKLMNDFYNIKNQFSEFFGENNLDTGQVTKIGTEHYLIPPKCRFFNKPVEKLHNFLNTSEKFDYIVIDPPFKCKYIKRLKKTCSNKSYQMLPNEEIIKIPIQNYTHKNTLVIIWCTNSDIHEKFIKEEVMNEWNLKLIACWKWVKIDKSGEMFCPFDGSKKPYEKIFIATHSDNDKNLNLSQNCMIFSQPSSIHSHKPPLKELFRHVIPSQPKCLEIFARSLYENHTSVGLECLKLQNRILFDELLTGPELSNV